jgi:hypothetical protein
MYFDTMEYGDKNLRQVAQKNGLLPKEKKK